MGKGLHSESEEWGEWVRGFTLRVRSGENG